MTIDEMMIEIKQQGYDFEHAMCDIEDSRENQVMYQEKGEQCKQLADWLEQLKEYQQLEEQGRLIKFYYCESLNEYYVGKRCDNFYYAKVEIQSNGDACLCYKWSRYLPWGKSVVDELSSWKEYTYPSEPKEISFEEWLKGWLCEVEATMNELRGEENE